ncbi:MAG: hypothetical protein JWQ27_548 [Ferruginibacter sp.]|nr:hypothetical protein [Ferruginibacter sp.]
MKQLDTYKNFLNGRYLNEGIRITAGILLPALLMSYFHMLEQGIIISLGALCVSVTDSPGPIRHRSNGMIACVFLITMVAVLVYFIAAFSLFLALLIFVFGFLFSMLSIYGARSSSVGIAALLIMILSLQTPVHGMQIWYHALYIFTGGCWYFLFSMLLYTIRPYKIIQQVLGDFIIDISDYLKTRGSFYKQDPEYEKTYQQLLQLQVKVQSQQSLLSDMLFKTRTIIKESTHTGRVLVKLYVDMAELFESIMTAFQDYKVLHKQFDDTGILEEYGNHIVALSAELNAVGLSVKSGLASKASGENLYAIKNIRQHFEQLRQHYMSDKNVDQFISLGRIQTNLQHLTEKIDSLHHYTSYDKRIKKASATSIDYSNYGEKQDIRPAIFFNNLNFKSNIFRHALRVAFALLLGYIISVAFHIGHNYWILLTIVVILKPAYSLTKKRNSDRLIGTFLGIFIGIAVMFFIKDKTVLLVIMIIFMASSYAFMRTSYFISVLMMTPYLVIFFHLLYPSSLQILLTDRIIDTVIGSGIAFMASIFFVPAWEHSSIKNYMLAMLDANQRYYEMLTRSFINSEPVSAADFKNIRRDILTSLANVSDAFNRMLSEPKRYQKGIEAIHRFVVLNHILTSHFAALAYYLNVRKNPFRSKDFEAVLRDTTVHFSNAAHYLNEEEAAVVLPARDSLDALNQHAALLLEKRRTELALGQLETETKDSLVQVKSVTDQFNYIYNISADISRCCKQMNA